jgi:hypothetical protein
MAPSAGRIAFVGADGQIHVMRGDGSEARPVTFAKVPTRSAAGARRRGATVARGRCGRRTGDGSAVSSPRSARITADRRSSWPWRRRRRGASALALEGELPIYAQWNASGDRLAVLTQSQDELALAVCSLGDLGNRRTVDEGRPSSSPGREIGSSCTSGREGRAWARRAPRSDGPRRGPLARGSAGHVLYAAGDRGSRAPRRGGCLVGHRRAPAGLADSLRRRRSRRDGRASTARRGRDRGRAGRGGRSVPRRRAPRSGGRRAPDPGGALSRVLLRSDRRAPPLREGSRARPGRHAPRPRAFGRHASARPLLAECAPALHPPVLRAVLHEPSPRLAGRGHRRVLGIRGPIAIGHRREPADLRDGSAGRSGLPRVIAEGSFAVWSR